MAMTRGKKILIGCLVALAVAIASCVLLVILFVSWLRAPGPELAGNRLVDAGTRGYAAMGLRQDDEHVRELIRLFVREQRAGQIDLSGEEIPPILRTLVPVLQGLGNQEVPDEDLDKLLPLTLFVTTDTSGEPVMAVNFPSSGHTLVLVDWVLARAAGGGNGMQRRDHDGESLYRLQPDHPVVFSIVRTHLLLSTSEESLIRAIDLLGRPEEQPSPTALTSAMAALPEKASLRLVLLEDSVARLPSYLADSFPFLSQQLAGKVAGAGRITGWGQLESTDGFSGTIRVEHGAVAASPPADGDASRYTFQFMDDRIRLVVEDGGRDAAGTQEWQFQLSGLESLIAYAARQAAGGGMTIRP